MATKIGYERHLDPESLPTLQDITVFIEKVWHDIWFKIGLTGEKDEHNCFVHRNGAVADGWVNSTGIAGIRSFRMRARVWPLPYYKESYRCSQEDQELVAKLMKEAEEAAHEAFPGCVRVTVRKFMGRKFREGWETAENPMDYVESTGEIREISYSVKIFYRSDRRYDPYKHTR